jgi:hypothetical protein
MESTLPTEKARPSTANTASPTKILKIITALLSASKRKNPPGELKLKSSHKKAHKAQKDFLTEWRFFL